MLYIFLYRWRIIKIFVHYSTKNTNCNQVFKIVLLSRQAREETERTLPRNAGYLINFNFCTY